MLSAIEFDNQSALDTTEIRNVRADRMLSPEFCAGDLSRSQMFPQPRFYISLRLT
jgi:hypothetical protein